MKLFEHLFKGIANQCEVILYKDFNGISLIATCWAVHLKNEETYRTESDWLDPPVACETEGGLVTHWTQNADRISCLTPSIVMAEFKYAFPIKPLHPNKVRIFLQGCGSTLAVAFLE